MSQKLICQICSGENDPSAQRCANCGAIFDTLPDDLRPKRAANAKTNEPLNQGTDSQNPTDDSESTDWLKKYYKDLEFNEADEPSELPQSDAQLNSDEPAPDLLSELFPDIRDSIAASIAATPPTAHNEDEQVQAASDMEPDEAWRIEEKAPEPRPVKTAKSPEESDERDFEDFSVYRPERKWDDFSLADGQDDPADVPESNRTAAKTEPESADQRDETEEDYVDFSKIRPETKLGDDGLGMDKPHQPAPAGINFELKEIPNEDLSSEKSSEPPAQDSTEKKPDLDDSERNGDNGEPQSAEEDYVDFSIHRPQNKLEPALTDPAIKDISTAQEAAVSDEIPIEPAEGFESSPLVDEFLASLNGDHPAAPENGSDLDPNEIVREIENGDPNKPTAYDEIAAFWNSDTKPEPDDEMPERYLSDMQGAEQPTAGDGRNEEETTPKEKPDAPAVPRMRPVNVADDDEDSDAPIPFVSKADGADEIPWNLFENSEMVFPSPSSFSRSSYKSVVPSRSGESGDYQERMVASILNKVFHAERLSRGMRNGLSRKKHRAGLLAFSLIAILGVLFILGGNVGADLPLSPAQGNASVQSAAFTDALAEITAADRVEIILDYTFAFETELGDTTRFVVDEFRRIGTRVTVIAANDAAVTLAVDLFPVTGDFGRVPVSAVMDPLGAFTLPPNELDGAPDALVLFVADAARAQRWIEAARLFRPETDLLVVSAAQAAPMLRPFVASGTVRAGLLTADEREIVSGAAVPHPEQVAVWYLIGTAIAAMLLGTIARHPFTPVIATEENGNNDDSGDKDDADENDEKNNGKGAGKR